MTTTGRTLPRSEPRIERASATDRAFLAMDTGEVPEQFGVILRLDAPDGLDLTRARRLVAERLPAVPRLRQRLVRVPPGCGGPIWVDDPDFDIRRHVRAVHCPAPGDEHALLDTALPLFATPLPATAPLWSAVFVTGVAEGGVALVLVLHHALADGVGGLAVLAGLVDPGSGADDRSFPRPRPSDGALARAASLEKLRSLRRAAQSWQLLRRSMTASGGLRPPAVGPCSLNQRIGPRRTMAVVRADVTELRSAAHLHGATTNDALLVAVAAALHRVLLARGESVDPIVITVPVSGRPPEGEPDLGNMVSPMLVSVPTTGDVAPRLQQVAAQVRAHKASATGPPPIAVLGPVFRLLASLGGYGWYMNHQRRMHTLLSHVRGPAEPLTFDGRPITSAIPVGVADGGNVAAYFEVLSYAGTVTISTIVDPDHFPDLDGFARELRRQLDLVVHASAG